MVTLGVAPSGVSLPNTLIVTGVLSGVVALSSTATGTGAVGVVVPTTTVTVVVAQFPLFNLSQI